MKKTFTPIAVPRNQEGYKKGDLIRQKETYFWRIASYGADGSHWQAHDIVFVSDEEIKEGDACIAKDGTICIRAIAATVEPFIKHGWRKIHFSTNPTHGLPLIPDSFKQVWCDRQGKVDKIEVEYIYSYNETDGVKYIPDTIDNGCIVVTVPDEITTKETPILSEGSLQKVWGNDAPQPAAKTPLRMLEEAIYKHKDNPPDTSQKEGYLWGLDVALLEIPLHEDALWKFAEDCFNAGVDKGVLPDHADDFETFIKRYNQ